MKWKWVYALVYVNDWTSISQSCIDVLCFFFFCCLSFSTIVYFVLFTLILLFRMHARWQAVYFKYSLHWIFINYFVSFVQHEFKSPKLNWLVVVVVIFFFLHQLLHMLHHAMSKRFGHKMLWVICSDTQWN